MGTYKGLDYFKWAKEMDIVSWDNYPAYNTPWSETAMRHDLMRGLKNQPFMLMEQTPSQQNSSSPSRSPCRQTGCWGPQSHPTHRRCGPRTRCSRPRSPPPKCRTFSAATPGKPFRSSRSNSRCCPKWPGWTLTAAATSSASATTTAPTARITRRRGYG